MTRRQAITAVIIGTVSLFASWRLWLGVVAFNADHAPDSDAVRLGLHHVAAASHSFASGVLLFGAVCLFIGVVSLRGRAR